ncbi:Lycopene beta-cyclase [Rhodovastum atsumiense]|uniref:Lycopene beta-cyclase CrtY n=1 Tax=Rhodovastum atsumiense TaxID=504468 RepID=A0A5M6IRV5_9PROT|nr:lycopene beta-cyclase CrtY [Rhodovastum atsumiense]KAA5610921.1 lycopene beta-cyclase CrtY [Rhodovastum atsumiense]CAH2601509.1 Lycopene beta-cyclase [Rhodovastum atsumiense]
MAQAPWPSAHERTHRYDVVFAGMGLANALTALRIRARHPYLRIAGFDPNPAVGAGRTWSFFASDVTPAQLAWLRPLLRQEWPAYEVRFPGLRRLLDTPLCTLSGPALQQALTGIVHHGEIREVHPDHVILTDGAVIEAGMVLDGRGARPSEALQCGWQKFMGQEIRLTRPHGLRHPVLMDACVDQFDGFRFMYLLPFGPDRLLVEDTRYSDTPVLAPGMAQAEIAAYIAAQGWEVAELLAQEHGVLPVVLDGDIAAFWAEAGPAAPMGMRAGLFHPLTGYSLPSAVMMADVIARVTPMRPQALRDMIEHTSRVRWRDQGFYRLLSRLLFQAGRPDQRWRVFERFFTLRQPLVERFFAGRSTALDRARVLTGRPPVPIGEAVRCITAPPFRMPTRDQPAGLAAALVTPGSRDA